MAVLTMMVDLLKRTGVEVAPTAGQSSVKGKTTRGEPYYSQGRLLLTTTPPPRQNVNRSRAITRPPLAPFSSVGSEGRDTRHRMTFREERVNGVSRSRTPSWRSSPDWLLVVLVLLAVQYLDPAFLRPWTT